MTTVLFVHNGVPGRFAFIARALVRRGDRCALINGPSGLDLPGVPSLRWGINREPPQNMFPAAARAELDLVRGKGAAEAATALKAQGFDPQIIIGHPGWGEMTFLDEVFPGVPQIQIGEFYYRTEGADVGFDPEFGMPDLDERIRVHAKNAVMSLSYTQATRIVCPTPFQASTLPAIFRDRVHIIHEGVDTDLAVRAPDPVLRLKSGPTFDRSRPVITFVNRTFEPLRGFHVFMRALPRLLAQQSDAQVLLIGNDAHPAYGQKAKGGLSWKQTMLDELAGQLDLSRIHFTGPLTYNELLTAMSLSAAHVYLTYPFVLSWSLLDAMACECLVVGSDTAPVRDVVRPGENGLLVDFFDHNALADTLIEVCRAPGRYEAMRRAARQTVVSAFDRKTRCEPAWLTLIEEVLRGAHP